MHQEESEQGEKAIRQQKTKKENSVVGAVGNQVSSSPKQVFSLAVESLVLTVSYIIITEVKCDKKNPCSR